MAADPSYPALPITNLLCSSCLLVLILINFLRRSQSFNLVVNVLAICLFWETLVVGINMIVWADDAHLDFPFSYCDIGEP